VPTTQTRTQRPGPDTAAFVVLAEPVRRRILDLLLERPRLVGDLTTQLGLSQPGTSKHLRVLREAGLVRVRPDAQRRWYELRPEPLAEMDAWLAPYRRLWSERLDALGRHLDAMPDEPDEPAMPDEPDDQDGPDDPEHPDHVRTERDDQ
jgi:DNA-binding transcriptional ArsR family regulator